MTSWEHFPYEADIGRDDEAQWVAQCVVDV